MVVSTKNELALRFHPSLKLRFLIILLFGIKIAMLLDKLAYIRIMENVKRIA